MILDEIYEEIKKFRIKKGTGEYSSCPFFLTCNYCRLIFREIVIPKHDNSAMKPLNSKADGSGWPGCPCLRLGDDYVESEMQRLFP